MPGIVRLRLQFVYMEKAVKLLPDELILREYVVSAYNTAEFSYNGK